jgi:hypothetical protein
MKIYVKFEAPTFCQTRSGFSRCPKAQGAMRARNDFSAFADECGLAFTVRINLNGCEAF